MKTCTKCGVAKTLDNFNKQGAPRTGLKTICKSCDARYAQKWRAASLEKRRAYHAQWCAANKDKVAAQDARRYAKNAAHYKERSRLYRAAHPEKMAERNRRWDKNNPAKRAAMVGYRRAQKRQATPGWANKFFIEEIYDLARLRTKVTGFPWHVDHIVPLKHPLVCGLHVEDNLQVIPATENSKKKNYYWPDMP